MNTARPRVRSLADLLRLFVPPGVWFTHFAVVYGTEALVCMPPVAQPSTMIWTGAAATALALAALVAFAFMQSRTADRNEHTGAGFLHGAALLLALLSGLGVIWTAFPLAVLPVCVSPAG